jgi:DNA-binding Xre family transcriptional regulator
MNIVENSPEKSKINDQLELILNQKGVTKYKLSKDTGISLKTLYSVQNRDVRLSTVLIICKYLKIQISELIPIDFTN